MWRTPAEDVFFFYYYFSFWCELCAGAICLFQNLHDIYDLLNKNKNKNK